MRLGDVVTLVLQVGFVLINWLAQVKVILLYMT